MISFFYVVVFWTKIIGIFLNFFIFIVEIKNLEIYLGVVIKVRDGIAIIRGLDKAKAGEVLEFSTGVKGLALNLSHNEVSAVIFGNEKLIKEGVKVRNTGNLMTVGVSSKLLGRVINVIGETLDSNIKVEADIEIR